MRHQQEHSRRRGYAAQSPCKKTHRRAEIDQHTERGYACNARQNVHGSLACSQVLSGNVKSEHFRIRRKDKKHARDHGALDNRPGNRFQRVPRFRPKRRGAFKSDKAKHSQH